MSGTSSRWDQRKRRISGERNFDEERNSFKERVKDRKYNRDERNPERNYGRSDSREQEDSERNYELERKRKRERNFKESEPQHRISERNYDLTWRNEGISDKQSHPVGEEDQGQRCQGDDSDNQSSDESDSLPLQHRRVVPPPPPNISGVYPPPLKVTRPPPPPPPSRPPSFQKTIIPPPLSHVPPPPPSVAKSPKAASLPPSHPLDKNQKKTLAIKLGGSRTLPKIGQPKAIKPSQKVASVFGQDSSDSEEEEMPMEAKMRMRNVGRETITSSGPNSFGKTKQGFVDAKKLFEKQLQEAMDEVSGGK